MSRIYLLIVLIVVVSQVFETYGSGGGSCYAAPNFWGPECSSSTSIFGTHGLRIRYSMTINGNAGTLVCCEGYSAGDGRFHSMGCGHDSFSWTLEWGNNIATPKIKCKGTPFGATVSWSH
ncbi:Hypothetical predicted protein [Mytilus galloprovincialis]|uniref:Uncharacterized protein n=1 Tax=Mytilus galloprovincialis TaxID=29158 RepID=A0A8B6GXI6_MYTGA|nr:Hypothetical predicted protein [Mytilus galloprovincialis]